MSRNLKWVVGIVVLLSWGCTSKTAPSTPPTGGPPQKRTPEERGPIATEEKPTEAAAAPTEAAAAPTEAAAAPTEAAAAPTARVPLAEIFVLPPAENANDKLSAEELNKLLGDAKNHEPFVPEAPLGLADVASFVPAGNPMTRAKVELGRMLYFDPRLSRDSTVACVTCHDPAFGWAQNTAVASGIDGHKGGRNSPTVMNRVFGKTQFWDGRAATLEEQALGPTQNPIEMGFTLDELVERLKGIEGYRLCFEKVFGEVSAENIAKAIATFERTVLVGASPYDYFVQAEPLRKLNKEELDADPTLATKAKAAIAAADAHPLSESADRGRQLFFGDKAGCSACHVGTNLSDELFHNLGVGLNMPEPDLGRFAVTKDEKDTGAFKTPTLRNIALNAPYMHDGHDETLMDTVMFYDKGGTPNPHLSQRMKKLGLSQQEREDLVAFMQDGLTGSMPDIKAPKLP